MYAYSRSLQDTGNWTLDELSNEQEKMLIPAIVITAILMVVGAAGNGVVIYVHYYRFKPSNHRECMLSLGVCNLITCVVCIPSLMAIDVLPYLFTNSMICKLLQYIQHMTFIVSLCIVLLIAIDRYRKINRPLNTQISLPIAKGILYRIAIITGLIAALPSYFVYGHSTVFIGTGESRGVECFIDDAVRHTALPIAYVGTMFAMVLSVGLISVYCYAKIAYKRYHRAQKRYNRNNVAVLRNYTWSCNAVTDRSISNGLGTPPDNTANTEESIRKLPMNCHGRLRFTSSRINVTPVDTSIQSRMYSDNDMLNDCKDTCSNDTHYIPKGKRSSITITENNESCTIDIVPAHMPLVRSSTVNCDNEGSHCQQTCRDSQESASYFDETDSETMLVKPCRLRIGMSNTSDSSDIAFDIIDSCESDSKYSENEREKSGDNMMLCTNRDRKASITEVELSLNDTDVYNHFSLAQGYTSSSIELMSMSPNRDQFIPETISEEQNNITDLENAPNTNDGLETKELEATPGEEHQIEHSMGIRIRLFNKRQAFRRDRVLIRMTKMLFVIHAVHFVSFVPHFALMIILIINDHFLVSRSAFETAIFYIAFRSFIINAVCTPFIYNCTNNRFKEECYKLWRSFVERFGLGPRL